MDKIKELRAKIEEAIGKLKALLDKADEEKRDLTDAETQEYATTEQGIDKMNRDLERLEKLEALNQQSLERAEKPHVPMYSGKHKDDPKEWKSIGDFLHSICHYRNDPRLQNVEYREPEERNQTMGTGTEGGFALPEQFRPQLLQVQPAEAIFRPRCTIIPAGDPPDAKVTMPALDQSSNQNVYGGVVMYKIGEVTALTLSSIALRQVSLEPAGIGGYMRISNKLLANWQASGGLLAAQMRKALTGFEDTQFYNGDGVGGPLGVLSSSAAIVVNRGTANTIVSADIINMVSRVKMGGSYVWVASQTTLPQLTVITGAGAGATNIFAMDYTKPIPTTLMGIPVMFHDRSVALGTKGDLILVDLSYYLIKDGSGPFVDTSQHVQFLTNETLIKITYNVDGKPWLNAPLPLEGSTTNTVSPFVVLN